MSRCARRAEFDTGQWRRIPAAEQTVVLTTWAQLIEDNRDELAVLICLDGLPVRRVRHRLYTEAAVGIAVKPARHGCGLGLLDLVTGRKNDSLHSYVLALPVNTEIAQVRGHDGYGFPKWVTRLDVDIERTSDRVANDQGGLDLALSVPTPKQTDRPTGAHVSTLTSYTTIDGAWHSTTSQINMLASGTTRFPRGLDLQLGEGRTSEVLRALKPIRTIQLDVTTEGQLALHMPVPTSVQDRS